LESLPDEFHPIFPGFVATKPWSAGGAPLTARFGCKMMALGGGYIAMRGIAVFCVLSLLTGCAASGVKVTEEQAESFKVGVSSYSDVVTSLGPPTSTSVSSNGARTAVYTYAAVRSQAQNFIPYIGGFVAGYDTQKSDVAFTFDQRGILTNMSSTQTGIGTGANLAAGANAAAAPYQLPK
jgi:hypothetical protein